MLSKTRAFILKDTYFITPKIKHFKFEPQDSSSFNYRPGQFITIIFQHQGQSLKRSYSIANPPGQNFIEIAATYVEGGPGTTYLFNLNPGDVVHMAGPYGRLVLQDSPPQRLIFAATSTGITPLRAMRTELEQHLLMHPEFKLVMLLGVQTREDILYKDEWLDFARQFRNFECKFHLSRMHNQALNEYECHGYVQEGFDALQLNPDEDYVYLCGNPSMIDTSFEILTKMGFKTTHIVREKYISSSFSASNP